MMWILWQMIVIFCEKIEFLVMLDEVISIGFIVFKFQS